MKSLEGYLQKIYTDFEKEVKKMDSLCSMASLNYQTQQLPDYQDSRIQQLYLLKYAYAYAYEYYLMYDRAVRMLGIQGKLSVVSLGCGAMVDYIGLQSVEDGQPLCVEYTGIDRIDWHYKPSLSPQDVAMCRTGITAGAYLQEQEMLDADIYMFPKSISELSPTEVEKICNCFRYKKNRKDSFALCISLRNSDVNRRADLNKTAELEVAIQEGGYLSAPENHYYYIFPQNCGIIKYEQNYNYPEQALELLSQLGTRCGRGKSCRQHSHCQETMNRYPVLKTKEVCYQIMKFERRKAA